MDTYFLFLIKGCVAAGLFYVWYRVALRGRRLHTYNRFFLLAGLAATITLPLLRFSMPVPALTARVPLPAFFAASAGSGHSEGLELSAAQAQWYIDWLLVARIVVIAVSTLLVMVLLVRVLWLLRLARKQEGIVANGVKIITTELQPAPFSFFRTIFLRSGMDPESDNGRMIYNHELVHVKQGHSYDKVFSQIVTAICWVNPFCWLLQKELGMVHEFIADGAAVAPGDEMHDAATVADAFARMLLQRHDNGNYLLPAHQFFSSPIKRRLTMLNTASKPNYAALRKLAVVPLLAAAAISCSFRGTVSPIARASEKIVVVVDAGHGGLDKGAAYQGLVEKDLNLRIARRMAELAPGFNVEVHLTRSDDSYVTLVRRVEVANHFHPDFFISLHVNDRRLPSDMATGPCIEVNEALQATAGTESRTTRLGASIYTSVCALEGTSPAPYMPVRKSLQVLRNNAAPAILIELGDIKNHEQVQWISDDKQLDKLCGAILTGIVHAGRQ